MKRVVYLIFALALVLNSVSAQIYEPVKWNFELKKTSDKTADVILTANIQKGWHIYGLDLPPDGPVPTTIKFDKIENSHLLGKLQAKSKLHKDYDAGFKMELTWYVDKAVFVQPISFTDASKVEVTGSVRYMSCNDENCTPPSTDKFDLKLSPSTVSEHKNKAAVVAKPEIKVDTVAESRLAENTSSVSKTQKTDLWAPVIDQLKSFEGNQESESNMALWLIFLAGLAGGFLALFTPCVWPIIPMTVSFFLKRSENKRKGRRDAVFYGLAIIVIYVVLGILITLIFGASALNSMATNAVFNLIFFALLIFFAISFFGAFEITLPSSWSTKMDAKADSTAGFLSIMFMAFTLVLVSFSCTGPIIGTTLVQVASTGNLLAPAIAMFGFSFALAIPFTFFAFFPSMLKSLPKSGGWLNKVKVVLAFLELALSLKFLSVADLAYGWHILDREVFLSLWIIIFALLGFYLLGKIRFPHDSESKHTSVSGVFMAIISFAFAIYMVPGLWGAPLKSISAFSPPLNTQDFNLYHNEVEPKFTDYETGMMYAKDKNLPVVIDFTGFGCVNCRKMEASVWTDPTVKDMLDNDFVLISLYVDDKTNLKTPYDISENGRTRTISTIGDKWSYLQREKFGANAQPFYVILNEKGQPLNSPFTFDENPQDFIKWLKSGKGRF